MIIDELPRQAGTRGRSDVEFDPWASAELVARAGLEPDLADRYASDPARVLAEFGLPAAPGGMIAIDAAMAQDLVVEELDQPDTEGVAWWCVLCTGTFTPVAPGEPR